MPRIIGIDIPKDKRIEISLTYIHGIGRARAKEVLDQAGIAPGLKAGELDDKQITKITQVIQDNYQVEGDLRRLTTSNIKRLMSINCYRGIRHKRGLPVRGQCTQTNARTRKGPKRTVGVYKDKTQRAAAKSSAK